MTIKMYVTPPRVGGFYVSFIVDGNKVRSESLVSQPKTGATIKKKNTISTYAPNLWPMPIPLALKYEHGVLNCCFNFKNIGLKDALSPKIKVDEVSNGVILKDFQIGDSVEIGDSLSVGESSFLEFDFDVPRGIRSFKATYHLNCLDERGYNYSFGDVNHVMLFVEDRKETTQPWIYRIYEDKYVNLSGEVEWDDLPSISPDGSLIAYDARRAGAPDIWIMKVDGTGKRRLTHTGNNRYASWSPDGSKIAFQSWRDGNHQIYLMNPDGLEQKRLTNNKYGDGCPTFSADGSRIAFSRNEKGGILDFHSHIPQNLWVMDADGTEERKLTFSNGNNCFAAWSPDASMLAFRRSVADFRHKIYVVNADGTGERNLSMDPEVNDMDPFWSPGGTHIAFSSKRGAEGWSEIYIMRNDGTNKMRVVYAPGPSKEKISPLIHEAMTKPMPGGAGGDFYPSWYRK